MSDDDTDDGADSGDSGFDKEAEREKLREKFAEDEKRRESTRRMSELLLKGATMTNRHCDNCGSPVFRQNGQEFCPTCDAADGEVPADAGDGNAGGADRPATPAGGDGEFADAADPESPDTVGTGAPPDAAGSVAGGEGTDRSAAPAHDPGNRRTPPSQSAADAAGDAPAAGRSAPDRKGNPVPAGGTGGRDAAARDALVEAVTRHANAAATADARTAREHLEAAREAAEALAALDRGGR